MKFTFISSLFTALLVTLFSSFQSMAATEMHGVMCGGEIRAADNAVVEEFMADNPGVCKGQSECFNQRPCHNT